ncbi:uncharacterized protein LOC116261524 [Nymphaea colorata]|nr:uncharacterized protein LOC116261524 [Nymphaea colorata]XP_049935375.1 uncharacterized protein LOC116261524 [Nymphaea colorata]XP_049935377.1 uncharacterized protein LOC116261524 [Nymphaea colorata]XP_049935378.1 uncharacterized protein LOC116261524 [Nymphaea colorata]
MGSYTGLLHRPFAAAAAAAVAAVSADVHDKFPVKFHDSSTTELTNSFLPRESPPVSNSSSSSKSFISIDISLLNCSHSSVVPRVLVPTSVTDAPCPVPISHLPRSQLSKVFDMKLPSSSSPYSVPSASPAVLGLLYQSANLTPVKKLQKSLPSSESTSSPGSPSDVLYEWHSPQSGSCGIERVPKCCGDTSKTTVVLLGWLGAKQKHLKRYAEWYTSRGFNAVTFTFPMSDVVSYTPGGKAEQHLGLLVNHLAHWMGEDDGNKLIFHTFSNTGWLTYGVILEKLSHQDQSMIENIKGCIVDSAPVAAPDPQVWASGFSAAILQKQSVATKGSIRPVEGGVEIIVDANTLACERKPAVTEAALLAILEKFFEVVLNLPSVNKRLSDVLDILSSKQPKCPQLYIYSTADRVIPAKSVESFIDEQRKTGHNVRACNFIFSPHVDHFRNNPSLYSSQLTGFLEDCVLMCKES